MRRLATWILAGAAASAGLLAAGCGRSADQGPELVRIVLTDSGPVKLEGQDVPFHEVGERLVFLGAQPYTRIEVAVAPQVPRSRQAIFADQLSKNWGFRKVVFVLTPRSSSP